MAPQPPPIRACLFDMDGLLLNSEDLYSHCTNVVLKQYNKPQLPWSIKAQLQGRPGPQAGRIFSAWAQLPISHEEFLAQQSKLQREVFPSCEPLAGVEVLLKTLAGTRERSDGGTKIALATSSHSGNYKLKTDHLRNLFDLFEQENVVLGDDERIPKGRGKPCPDIYLLALETINAGIRKEGGKEIQPAECLVFEDSVPGVESGRRAGMQVVWCPHPGLLNEYKGKEKEVLAGRSGMVHAEVGSAENGNDMSKDAPGEIDDGWGKFVPTLENFDYASYGIKI